MVDYKAIRQQLHEHPQTAGCEQFAHDMIVRHLQGLHPDKVYTHVGGYGVIAVWSLTPDPSPCGEGSSNQVDYTSLPTIVFRADTDALPIGHRCGHDGHTTILLRLAELIDNEELRIKNEELAHHKQSNIQTFNILLLWQPAEETGTGSMAVIESGILQQYNIKAFYGLHNLPGYPLGSIVLCPHTFAAASTGVVYHLDGRETHASTPEMGVNPGLTVAEIIKKFDGFNGADAPAEHYSGEFRQSTLICVRVGEPAFGTSAGHGEVMFTLRAFTNNEMERLLANANNAVDEIAGRYGLTVTRTLVEPFRATENHEECVNVLVRECGSPIIKEEPFRWSEDFAEYLLRWPGAMFGMGSGEQHAELHHPEYDFPDELIEPAAQMFFRLAQGTIS